MDRQRAIIGYLLVAAGSAMFSSKAIFIKLAYLERPDPLLMLAWRMAFALPVFLLVGAVEVFRRRKDGRPMPGPAAILGAVAVGLVGYYLAMILDFCGTALCLRPARAPCALYLSDLPDLHRRRLLRHAVELEQCPGRNRLLCRSCRGVPQ